MKFFRNIHTEAEAVAGERLLAAANNAAEMARNTFDPKPIERRPVHEVTNENLHRTYGKAQTRLIEVEKEIETLLTEKAQLQVTMQATNAAINILSEFGVETAIDRELREAFRDDAESVNAA